mgnify:CR=1 FL=1
MNNEYKDEFDEVMNLNQFKHWLARNIAQFMGNINTTQADSSRSLREWVSMFLSWSEYTENKNENE